MGDKDLKEFDSVAEFQQKLDQIVNRPDIDPERKLQVFDRALDQNRIGLERYNMYVDRVYQPAPTNVVQPLQPEAYAPGGASEFVGPPVPRNKPGVNVPPPPAAPPPAPAPNVAGWEKEPLPSPSAFERPPMGPFSLMASPPPSTLPDIYTYELPEMKYAEKHYTRSGNEAALRDLVEKGTESVWYQNYADGKWRYVSDKAKELGMAAVHMDRVTQEELYAIRPGLTKAELRGGRLGGKGQAGLSGAADYMTWGLVQQAMGLAPTNPLQKHMEEMGFDPDITEQMKNSSSKHWGSYMAGSTGSAVGGALLGAYVGGPAGAALGGLSAAALKALQRTAPKAISKFAAAPPGVGGRMLHSIRQGAPASMVSELGIEAAEQGGGAFQGKPFDPTQTLGNIGMRMATAGVGEGLGAGAGEVLAFLGQGGRNFFARDPRLREALNNLMALDMQMGVLAPESSWGRGGSKEYREAVKEASKKARGMGGEQKQGAIRASHVLEEKLPEQVLDLVGAKEKDIYGRLRAHNEELLAGLEDKKFNPSALINQIETALGWVGEARPTDAQLDRLAASVSPSEQDPLPFVNRKDLLTAWKRLQRVDETKGVELYTSARAKAPTQIGGRIDRTERGMSAMEILRIVEEIDYQMNESMAAAHERMKPNLNGMQGAIRDVRNELGTEYQEAMQDHAVVLTSLGNLKNELGILGKKIRKKGAPNPKPKLEDTIEEVPSIATGQAAPKKKRKTVYESDLLEPIAERLRMPVTGGTMPSPIKKMGVTNQFGQLRKESPMLERALEAVQEAHAREKVSDEFRSTRDIGVFGAAGVMRRAGIIMDAPFWGLTGMVNAPLPATMGARATTPLQVLNNTKTERRPVGEAGTKAEQKQKKIVFTSQEEKDAFLKLSKYVK